MLVKSVVHYIHMYTYPSPRSSVVPSIQEDIYTLGDGGKLKLWCLEKVGLHIYMKRMHLCLALLIVPLCETVGPEESGRDSSLDGEKDQ